jgi:hypothetical protein
MGLGEVGDELRSIVELINHERANLVAKTSPAAAARDRLHLLARGSRHPLVLKLIAAWDATLARLGEADQALASAGRAVVEYAELIGVNVGDSGRQSASAPGSAGGRLPEPDDPSVESSGPGGPGVMPAAIERLSDLLEPWRPSEDTVGYAYDAERRRLDDDRFVSGRQRAGNAGLKPPWRHLAIATDHVEGHVAARMREPGGPREVTLVINNEPCDDPLGCDKFLPMLMPRGSRLDVWVVGEDGPRLFKTYRGTGEGVAS